MANERVSWGLNIDALKDFEVVPNGLCRNTTFQHYACTISHMLIIYQAYMRNEVRSSAAVAQHPCPGIIMLLVDLQEPQTPAGLCIHSNFTFLVSHLPQSSMPELKCWLVAAEHAAGAGG